MRTLYKWKLGLIRLFSEKKYRELIEDRVWTNSNKFLSYVGRHWKVVFLAFLFFSEFARKVALHRIGVPVFVINSEPLLNIASYASSLYFLFFIATGLLVFVWLAPKLTGRAHLVWIGVLLTILWITGFVFMIKNTSVKPDGINEWKTGSGALAYISDTYEVVTTEGNDKHPANEVLAQVLDKRNRLYYWCIVKSSYYSDVCRKVTKSDVIIEAQ